MWTRLCAIALGLGMALSTEAAGARDLTVVSYGGALQEAVRRAFTEPFAVQTGRPVQDTTYGGSLDEIVAEEKAGAPRWDVVNIGAAQLLPGCRDGIYAPIDRSRLGEAAAMMPEALSDSPCGVGMLTGAMVMSFESARFPAAPRSWADFWDLARFPGKRGLKYDPEWTFEVALLADGVPPAEVGRVLSGPGGVDRAFAKLDSIKDAVRWYRLGGESVDDLASGAVSMTAAYNGRISAANGDKPGRFAIAWDAGSVYFMDYFAVLKSSPHRDAAMDFVAYATSARAQGAMPRYVGYGPTNLDAYKGMDPALAAELPNPDRLKLAVPVNDAFWLANGDALRRRFEAWAGPLRR